MLINDYFQEIRHLIEACPIVQSYNLITDSRSLYVGFAEKVRAKHSDRKSLVSPIGYCPNASPLQDAGR
ncbi:MAG: hypothetical protein EWV67_03775 [Microcystis sp. M_QC_C_20170808_M2Col]|nr:MAG: hypothetical protein EWV67_03775 [Microcystis sp. M_QC_C_20170808_M2Col]